MTAEQIAAIINLGAAGAVIIVVVYFLRFIDKRDADWRTFFAAIRQSDGDASTKLVAVIDKLVERVEALEDRFERHDVVEMEILRGISAKQDRRTTPRKLP